jgi:hypothetical protein
MAEKFEEVVAPAEKPNVPARGIEALATAGRRLGQLGNEKAAAIRQGGAAIEHGLNTVDTGLQDVAKVREQHDTTLDIVNSDAATAAAHNYLTQTFEQYKQDHAADPNMAENFQRDVVDPTIDNLNGAAQTDEGKRHVAEQTARMSMGWNDKLVSHQAEVTGANAKNAFESTMRSRGAAMLTDPADINNNVDVMRASADRVASLLPPGQQAAYKAHVDQQIQENVEAAIRNTQINPKDSNKPPPDIGPIIEAQKGNLGGPAIERLNKLHDEAVNSFNSNQRANIKLANEQATTTATAQFNNVFVSMQQPDGSIVPQPDTIDIVNKHWWSLPPEVQGKPEVKSAYESAIKLVHASLDNKNTVNDPDTIARLNSRMGDTSPLNPQEVEQALINKKINTQTAGVYRTWATEASKPGQEAVQQNVKLSQDIAKSYFMPKNPVTGGDQLLPTNAGTTVGPAHPEGPTAYAMFNQQFLAGLQKARNAQASGAKGADVDAYLQSGGPLSWNNPKSPNYINMPAIKKQAQDLYQSQTQEPNVAVEDLEINGQKGKSDLGTWIKENLGSIFGGK